MFQIVANACVDIHKNLNFYALSYLICTNSLALIRTRKTPGRFLLNVYTLPFCIHRGVDAEKHCHTLASTSLQNPLEIPSTAASNHSLSLLENLGRKSPKSPSSLERQDFVVFFWWGATKIYCLWEDFCFLVLARMSKISFSRMDLIL